MAIKDWKNLPKKQNKRKQKKLNWITDVVDILKIVALFLVPVLLILVLVNLDYKTLKPNNPWGTQRVQPISTPSHEVLKSGKATMKKTQASQEPENAVMAQLAQELKALRAEIAEIQQTATTSNKKVIRDYETKHPGKNTPASDFIVILVATNTDGPVALIEYKNKSFTVIEGSQINDTALVKRIHDKGVDLKIDDDIYALTLKQK